MAVLKLDAVAVAELARRHRDQRDAGPNKSKHRDSEHMDATSRCPAVASSKPPVAAVGVDSTAAVETLLQQEQVLEGLASMFAPQQL